jgi:hypothetical protein
MPDPLEHEVEFVFTGGGGGPRISMPKAAKAPKEPRLKRRARSAAVAGAETIETSETAEEVGRQVSRGLLAVLAAVLLLLLGVGAYALFFSDDDEPLPDPTARVTIAPTTAPTTAPTPAAVALPEECANGFLFAASRPDDQQNVSRTGDLCPTVDLWLEAAKQHPAAIGESSAADVGADDVKTFCANAEATAMCRDADRRGLLDATASPATSSTPPPAASPGTGSA